MYCALRLKKVAYVFRQCSGMCCKVGCTTQVLRSPLLRKEEPSTANAIRDRKPFRQPTWRRLSLFPCVKEFPLQPVLTTARSQASLTNRSEPQRESPLSEIQTTKEHASLWIRVRTSIDTVTLFDRIVDFLRTH